MPTFHRSDFAAIALGVITYIGIAGWLHLAPPFIAIATVVLGGAPPDFTGTPGLGRQIVAAAVIAIVGYVVARASQQAHLRNAAVTGVVLYVLVTNFNQLLWAAFEVDAPVQVLHEVGALVRAVFAAFVGGTVAQWHMRQRGAGRLDVGAWSRRRRGTLLAIALFPYLFFAATLRP